MIERVMALRDRGEVTIPKPIREKIGLKFGDYLKITYNETTGEIKMNKVKL